MKAEQLLSVIAPIIKAGEDLLTVRELAVMLFLAAGEQDFSHIARELQLVKPAVTRITAGSASAAMPCGGAAPRTAARCSSVSLTGAAPSSGSWRGHNGRRHHHRPLLLVYFLPAMIASRAGEDRSRVWRRDWRIIAAGNRLGLARRGHRL